MSKSVDDFRDIAAERVVLSGICRYGSDAYVDVADLIDTNNFTDEINQTLFKSIEHFYNDSYDKKLDIPSIISAARTLGLDHILHSSEATRYLRAIFNYPVEKETVRREAQKLFKLNLTRELDELTAQMRRDFRHITGEEALDEILAVAENPLFDFTSRLNQAGSDGPTQIAYGIDEFLDNLENHPRDNIGISSGYSKYDYYIGGGFRRSTVSIVGARMKQGKSVFCDNIALHIAGELKIPVLNLDTEMTREEHQARILAYVCIARFGVEVTIREIETGRYAQNNIKRDTIRKAAAWLKTIPYEYDTVTDKSFEEQISIMRRWVRRRVGTDNTGRTNDCLIIYDYLQPPDIGEFNENLKEYQVLGYQMQALLRTAGRCDVPIFTLVQLNRDGIDKESTNVAADSDRVLRKGANFTILKQKTPEEIAEDGINEGTHKLVIVIARHGEAMVKGDYINLKFDGRTARIVEGRTRNEIAKAKTSTSKCSSTTKAFTIENTNEPIEF